jgi:hypothetical protein
MGMGFPVIMNGNGHIVDYASPDIGKAVVQIYLGQEPYLAVGWRNENHSDLLLKFLGEKKIYAPMHIWECNSWKLQVPKLISDTSGYLVSGMGYGHIDFRSKQFSKFFGGSRLFGRDIDVKHAAWCYDTLIERGFTEISSPDDRALELLAV